MGFGWLKPYFNKAQLVRTAMAARPTLRQAVRPHVDHPQLSVVIPCHNAAPWLTGLIWSIQSQGVDSLEILVVDDNSTDRSRQILENLARFDKRIRILDGPGKGPGTARNLAIAQARGEYLTFADADDIVLPGAYKLMLQTLQRTGSDFVAGGYRRHRNSWINRPTISRRVHRFDDLRVTAITRPDAFEEPVLWNKIFRKQFWDEYCGPIPENVNYEDQPPIARAVAHAASFDILEQEVYSWRISEEGASRSGTKNTLTDIRDRRRITQMMWDIANAVAAPQELRLKMLQVWMNRDVAMYIPNFSRKAPNDAYREELRSWARDLVGFAEAASEITDSIWETLPVPARLNTLSLAHGSDDDVLNLLGVREERGTKSPPFDVDAWQVDSRYAAELGHERLGKWRSGVDDSNLVSPIGQEDILLQAVLKELDADADGALLQLAIFARGCRPVDVRELRAWVTVPERVQHESVDRGRSDDVACREIEVMIEATQANTGGQTVRDGNPADAASVREETGEWLNDRLRNTWFDYPDETYTVRLAKETFAEIGDEVQIRVAWEPTAGRVAETYVTLAGKFFTKAPVPLAFPPVSSSPVRSSSAGLLVPTRDANTGALVLQLQGGAQINDAGNAGDASDAGEVGLVQLQSRNQFVVLDSIEGAIVTHTRGDGGFPELGEAALVIHGRYGRSILPGGSLLPEAPLPKGLLPKVWLVSAAHAVPATMEYHPAGGITDPADGTTEGAGRFTARFPASALQSKTYSLRWTALPNNRFARRPVEAGEQAVSTVLYTADRGFELNFRNSKAVLHTFAPAKLAKATRWGSQQLEFDRKTPLRHAVYFEAFEGKTLWDNPGNILEEILRRRAEANHQSSQVTAAVAEQRFDLGEPELIVGIRSAAQLSEVPQGVRPVIVGTDAWFEAITTAAVLVTNNNLPSWWNAAAGQQWLQTWHGTPVKRLLFDANPTFIGLGYRRLMGRQAPQWSVLLAQTPRAGELLAGSSHYEGEVHVGEYPRNARLVQQLRDGQARTRIGIPEGKPVILWAPTWRYGAQITNFPAEELAQQLDAVVLIRGHHMRSIQAQGAGAVLKTFKRRLLKSMLPASIPSNAAEQRVIDVSAVPRVEDVLAVTDILISDYSSIFFDFALTGKPAVVFAPDLEYYAGQERGLYDNWPHSSGHPVVEHASALLPVVAQQLARVPAAGEAQAFLGEAEQAIAENIDWCVRWIERALRQRRKWRRAEGD